jgi:bacillithiol synthase
LKLIDPNITGHLPLLTLSYFNNKKELNSFYNRSNELKNYRDQIEEKHKNFNNKSRNILSQVLIEQYQSISDNNVQLSLIDDLSKSNTFTVTTGHQLNLFTGPLYFFYKIIDTIKICEDLRSKFPKNNFIPIYWMASEDHDFEEINFFKTAKKQFNWKVKTKGKVGDLNTEKLSEVFQEMSNFFDKENINVQKMISFFESSYLKNKNLSTATLHLVHKIFGKHGLVILNPDNKNLKKLMIDVFIDEIKESTCFDVVSKTNARLTEFFKGKIKPLVNPRSINLFYIKNNLRSRIEKNDLVYNVLESEISFTQDEIINEIRNYPERFSPNVLIRPLYQETILPNLAYVGGGSEIAYWLQLKEYFDKKNTTFPVLSIRSSVLLINKKHSNSLKKMNIEHFFKKNENLLKFYTNKFSKNKIDFTTLKTTLSDNFKQLYEVVKLTDFSFTGSVNAQEKKQKNGLDNLEIRLLKAEKKKNKEKLDKIISIKRELFPYNSFQEREINFSEFFQYYGDEFIDLIMKNTDPFDPSFVVIEL